MDDKEGSAVRYGFPSTSRVLVGRLGCDISVGICWWVGWRDLWRRWRVRRVIRDLGFYFAVIPAAAGRGGVK